MLPDTRFQKMPAIGEKPVRSRVRTKASCARDPKRTSVRTAVRSELSRELAATDKPQKLVSR